MLSTFQTRLKGNGRIFRRLIFSFIAIYACPVNSLAQPTISSFSPSSGPAATTITITGSNFDPNPANDIVYFGTVKGAVLTASPTVLTVTVPTGASYQPLTVTTGRLTAYSRIPFRMTVAGIDTAFVPSSFAPGKNIFTTAGSSTYNIYLADFDGDGKPDVFYPTETSASIIRNTSTPGTVSFSPETDYRLEVYARGGAIGDFDGDGKMDFVCNTTLDNSAHVFQNTSTPGAISFTPALTLNTGTEPIGATVTDLDGDGRPDLVVADNSVTLSVFRNTSSNGIISFAPPLTIDVTNSPWAIAYGDLDGDGRPDIAISCEYSVSVMKNTSTPGQISFGPRIDLATPADADTRNIVIADLDNDSIPDLAVTNSYGDFKTSISIFRNTSTGGTLSFAPRIDYASPYACEGLIGEDLNSDGRIDLITSNTAAASVCIYKNSSSPGQISFAPYVSYPISGGPYGLAAADMDGDGKTDFVTGDLVQSFAVSLNKINQPAITNFTPDTAAPSALITITGFNLSTTSSISIGGTPADSFSIISPTTLSARVGAGSSGAIKITTNYGSDSLAGFFLLPPPTLSFTIPFAAVPTSTFTLFGNHFIGVRSVTINGTPVSSYQVLNTGEIQAVVAPRTTSGWLVVETPTGKDSLNFRILQVPQITTVSPTSGPAGTPVIVTGRNFTAYTEPTRVRFGAAFGIITQNTDTSIIVQTPAGATYQSIAVLTNGLYGSSFSPFITTFQGAGSNFVSNSFLVTPTLSVATTPTSITLNDLDGDGKPDLIYARGTFLGVRLNTATDSINFSSESAIYAQVPSKSIIAQDLDGDQKPDLVTTNASYQSISLYQNTSTTSTLALGLSTTLGLNPNSPLTAAAVADLDGDGRPDIGVGNPTYGYLSIYHNASKPGAISFDPTSINFSLGFAPSFLAFADIDLDGKPDAIVGCGIPASYSILKNLSSPDSFAFALAKNFAVNAPVAEIATADLDADGKPDLILISHVANSSTSILTIVRNNSTPGNPEMDPAPLQYTIPDSISNVQIADLDGDGKADISFPRPKSNLLSVLKNTSSGGTLSFTDRVDYPTGTTPTGLVAGDLDGDGRPDLVAANSASNAISILQNQVGLPVVTPSGADPVSGSLIKTIYIDSAVQTVDNVTYVTRHYDIEPQNNSTGSTATVTLFFFQSDFEAFNAAPNHGLDLPHNPADAAGIAALRIYQYHGFSATGDPDSYSTPAIIIDPIDSNVRWNPNAGWWEVSFNISGFSGFFVGTGSGAPLPLTLLSFTGAANGSRTLLQWTTTNEANVRDFVIQKSLDDNIYVNLGSISATNRYNAVSNYRYLDTADNYPNSYYRLQMVDDDGKITYSKIVAITRNTSDPLIISPNPAQTYIRIGFPDGPASSLQLYTIGGQLLLTKQLPAGNVTTSLDVSRLARGLYMIIWNNGQQEIKKIFIIQ